MPKKTITYLSDKNFSKKIYQSDIWLIKFYSPVCGPCKRLSPDFKKVAKKLKKKKKIRCGRVNCLKSNDLSKKFKIRYYPCIKIIIPRKKKIITYKGINSRKRIYRFVLRMLKKYSDKKK